MMSPASIILPLFIVTAILFFVFGRPSNIDAALPDDKRYDSIIAKYAALNGIPFATLKAMIWRESNFNASARNDERLKGDPSDDAIGLLQIRRLALADYNRANGRMYTFPDDLFKPEINIAVGAWYLGSLAKRNGIETAIEMFNVGETGYKTRGARNSSYRTSVLARAGIYSA